MNEGQQMITLMFHPPGGKKRKKRKKFQNVMLVNFTEKKGCNL